MNNNIDSIYLYIFLSYHIIKVYFKWIKNSIHIHYHVNRKKADLSSWENSSKAFQKYSTCGSVAEQEEYSVMDFNNLISISATPTVCRYLIFILFMLFMKLYKYKTEIIVNIIQ